MKNVCCVFIFLFFSLKLFSQDTTVSLQQVLQSVVANYPSIQAKAALVKASGYSVAAAKKDYLPDLIIADQYDYATANGLSGSYYSNEGTSVSTSGSVHATNNYTGIFGSFTTLMIDWHAFDFGKVKQNVAFANAQQQEYNGDYKNEIFVQQIKAADIYLKLSLAQKLVAVQQENVQRALAFHNYVTARAVNGLLAGVDTSYANAQVANAQLALLQTEQQMAQQKVDLATASGIAENKILVDTTRFLISIPSGAFVYSASVENNPSLLFAKQQAEVEKQRSLVIKKSSLPTINIVGIGWARGSGIDDGTGLYSSKITDGIPYQTYNYMAGVAVKWNITSLAKTRQQYLAEKEVQASAQFNVSTQSLTLQAEFAKAKLQYNYTLQQAKLAPLELQSAQAAYTQSNARYQAGLATLPELVQSLYTLTQAEVDNALANNNAWRALLQEAAATGDLQIFLQQSSK